MLAISVLLPPSFNLGGVTHRRESTSVIGLVKKLLA
jgi:hypothetical protein